MFKKPETTTYDDGLETNLFEITKQICSEPPKAPCSIQLIMDHEADNEIEFSLIRDFTLACMQILFGPDATPGDLSEEQFDRLNQYVKSVGYKVNVIKEEDETSYIYKISFDRYHSSKPNPFEHLKKYMSSNTYT
jgi:hypothetical protein